MSALSIHNDKHVSACGLGDLEHVLCRFQQARAYLQQTVAATVQQAQLVLDRLSPNMHPPANGTLPLTDEDVSQVRLAAQYHWLVINAVPGLSASVHWSLSMGWML